MLGFPWPSPEVYVINLLIGVAVFFSFQWLLRKFVADVKRRKWAVWGATIIVVPIIYVGFILAMVASWSYVPKRDFSQERWFSDKESRYEMKQDLIQSRVLDGKTKEEVIQIIGEPDWQDTIRSTWTYDLGLGGGGLGFLFHNLKIQFDDDKVIKVEAYEIKD